VATKRKTVSKKAAPKRKAAAKKKASPKRKESSGGHILWNIPRAIRELDHIKILLPLFKQVALNKTWPDKKLENKLRKMLQKEAKKTNPELEVKTKPKSKNPGDMRTRAGNLRLFGLWYTDENNKVALTQAGNAIVESPENFYRQMLSQILRFQYPNPYHIEGRQKMDSSFKIFPHRFIITLLLDKKIKYLTSHEIAYFVLKTKQPSELKQVIKEIVESRKLHQKDKTYLKDRKSKENVYLIDEFNKKYRKVTKSSPQSVPDINKKWQFSYDLATTFMIHLQSFSEFAYEGDKISIVDSEYETVKEWISSYESSFPLSSIESKNKSMIDYANNYGMKFSNIRAARDGKKAASNKSKRTNKVINGVKKIKSRYPSLSKPEIITKVSESENMRTSEIEKIISQNPESFDFNELENNDFEKKYIKLAFGGTKEKTTIDFEDATRDIFEQFGFEATDEEVDSKSLDDKSKIEIFLTNGKQSAIVDSKSYANGYPLGANQTDTMIRYINDFEDYEKDSKKYTLTFFAYVYGKTKGGMKNFDKIIKVTGMSGSRISAHELLLLLKQFKAKKISKKEIWKLFQKNGEITSLDY
jgi:hypothetical protein